MASDSVLRVPPFYYVHILDQVDISFWLFLNNDKTIFFFFALWPTPSMLMIFYLFVIMQFWILYFPLFFFIERQFSKAWSWPNFNCPWNSWKGNLFDVNVFKLLIYLIQFNFWLWSTSWSLVPKNLWLFPRDFFVRF